MSIERIFYLGLVILGAVVPMVFLVGWLQQNGWSLAGMFDAWFANGATTGLTWDLLIAATALTVFILAELGVRKDPLPLIAIPATFLIGVSCGLPLYLFLRSRPLT